MLQYLLSDPVLPTTHTEEFFSNYGCKGRILYPEQNIFGHHREQHSNYPDQEVHDWQTTAAETNGHGRPFPCEGKGNPRQKFGEI